MTAMWDGVKLWLQRRLEAARAARRMTVVEQVSLGGKRVAVLLRVDGREFLLAGGADSIQSIQALNAVKDVYR